LANSKCQPLAANSRQMSALSIEQPRFAESLGNPLSGLTFSKIGVISKL
jgi:hypothetical protein